MAAATSSEVLERVAAVLKKAAVSDLPGYWGFHAEDGATFAAAEIKGALVARSYSASQVASFDRLHELTLSLATWRALILGGAIDNVSDTLLKTLDIREQLKTMLVFVDGVLVNPDSALGEIVGAGNAVGTGSGSLFNHPNIDTVDDLDW